jgi:YesN/AraC family two-component response regulator
VVKARVLELVVLLSRAALKGGAEVEEIFGLNYHYLQQINQFTTVEQLASWLARIMNRFSDLVFNLTDVKHVDVIFKALDYMRKNYMNKISLQDVAEAANISPSYFSKVFKDEMRCNFNVYLNQYRVEVAKKLLMDISIPLVNVAFLTGFEDQSYFSKVFKKITGMSPGKYRESMGRCREKTG